MIGCFQCDAIRYDGTLVIKSSCTVNKYGHPPDPDLARPATGPLGQTFNLTDKSSCILKGESL